MPCPNHCSYAGTCVFAKCFCDEGAQGSDCSLPAPPTPSSGVAIWKVVLLCVPLAAGAAGLGWLAKLAVDKRKLRRMRELLAQEAQRPFVSGLP